MFCLSLRLAILYSVLSSQELAISWQSPKLVSIAISIYDKGFVSAGAELANDEHTRVKCVCFFV